ncbi:hypothetical protein [Pseudonocardia adelaidensis]|uniref:Uncharacterized protein n=1 Tax=Pseudonocardia adelaidensis TaxID=648754 RepID=A0ABP9NRK2_9PSEU
MPTYTDVPSNNDPATNLVRHADEATNSVLSGLRQDRQGQGFDLPAAEQAVNAAHTNLVAAIGTYRAAVAAAVATSG